MEKLKTYVIQNFEAFFVLVLLITIVLLNLLVPFKIAFLNFYFLPVIASGYLLGVQRAVMGAFLCILIVVLYFLFFQDRLASDLNTHNLVIYIVTWGGFLILAGAVVGKLQERLSREVRTTRGLNLELTEQKAALDAANSSLVEYNDNLEQMVAQRTEELNKSRNAIENIKMKIEDTLYSTMDASVVKLIIEGRLRDEKRNISVMFTDLVSFTEYSERTSPELVIRDLNQYLKEMEEILMTYHAHIDKYLGDGIMCEFGAPHDFDNYRLLAVVCALKMQERMNRMPTSWRMRIGIASGSAIMGLIGNKRQSYTTLGDIVNLASRLESSCGAGGVLIDQRTKEGISRFIETRIKHDVTSALPETEERRIRGEIEDLRAQLMKNRERGVQVDLYRQLSSLYLSIFEAEPAVDCLEKAIKQYPAEPELKIAFAEATMKAEEFNKIFIKGKSSRVAAYEALGFKDTLLDRNKLTESFYQRYKDIVDRIEIPEDLILPSEVLAGTIGHGKVVALLSYAMAEHLGVVSDQEKREILQAGFLADIGKEVVPHHLLNRTKGGLSEGEYRELIKHCIESTRLLKQKGFESKQLLSIIHHSHERIDGKGFPDGLKGQEIPLGARIIRVADTYDALTSWRPYRDSWDRNAAFDELQKSVKKGQHDQMVVEALLAVLGR